MKPNQFFSVLAILSVLIVLPIAKVAAQGLPARQNLDDLTTNQITVLKAAMTHLVTNQPAVYLALQQRHDGGGGIPWMFSWRRGISSLASAIDVGF